MKIVPCFVLSCLIANPVLAHEFWISPEQFVYAPNDQVQVNLRVGEDFSGAAYSFNPSNFARFEMVAGDKVVPVEGRLGDIPALAMQSPDSGLVTIVHETDDSRLTYTKWEKFTKFVTHKAFLTTLEDHVARGIAKDEKFVERYRRFAKSLIAVGDGSGLDQIVGLRTEIVALDNPYQMAGESLRVRVLLEDAPKSNAQVELFEKAPDGMVEITLHQTDDTGEAQLPVKRGYSYLVDSVAMLPLDNNDPANGPVWESLWASLTFMVPEAPMK